VAFTYLKVKSAKCLCLLPVVLVLVLLLWSWSCKQRSWTLGLVTLVLVLVLRIWSCLHHCPNPMKSSSHSPKSPSRLLTGDTRPIAKSNRKQKYCALWVSSWELTNDLRVAGMAKTGNYDHPMKSAFLQKKHKHMTMHGSLTLWNPNLVVRGCSTTQKSFQRHSKACWLTGVSLKSCQPRAGPFSLTAIIAEQLLPCHHHQNYLQFHISQIHQTQPIIIT